MAYRRHGGQGGTDPHGGVPSGVHAPPHRHPGWQFIYVLEGKVVSQMEGEEAREYEAGQAWHEAHDHLHVYIGNESPDTWAKILVFYLTEPGQTVLVFEGAATPKSRVNKTPGKETEVSQTASAWGR